MVPGDDDDDDGGGDYQDVGDDADGDNDGDGDDDHRRLCVIQQNVTILAPFLPMLGVSLITDGSGVVMLLVMILVMIMMMMMVMTLTVHPVARPSPHTSLR